MVQPRHTLPRSWLVLGASKRHRGGRRAGRQLQVEQRYSTGAVPAPRAAAAAPARPHVLLRQQQLPHRVHEALPRQPRQPLPHGARVGARRTRRREGERGGAVAVALLPLLPLCSEAVVVGLPRLHRSVPLAWSGRACRPVTSGWRSRNARGTCRMHAACRPFETGAHDRQGQERRS